MLKFRQFALTVAVIFAVTACTTDSANPDSVSTDPASTNPVKAEPPKTESVDIDSVIRSSGQVEIEEANKSQPAPAPTSIAKHKSTAPDDKRSSKVADELRLEGERQAIAGRSDGPAQVAREPVANMAIQEQSMPVLSSSVSTNEAKVGKERYVMARAPASSVNLNSIRSPSEELNRENYARR